MSLFLHRLGSGALGGTYPDVLPLTAWWRDYTFPLPWNSTKSFGTSGSRAFDFFQGSPSAGGAQNGHNPVVIDQNAPDRLRATGITLPNVISTSGYEGWILLKFTSIVVGPSASGGIVGHAGWEGSFAGGGDTLGDSTSLMAGRWYLDGAGPTISLRHQGVSVVSGNMVDTNYHLVQFRWSNAITTASLRIDNGAWSDNTSAISWWDGTVTPMGALKVGNVNLISSSLVPVETPNSGYTPSSKGCTILEFALTDRYGVINFDLVRGYITTRYGLIV